MGQLQGSRNDAVESTYSPDNDRAAAARADVAHLLAWAGDRNLVAGTTAVPDELVANAIRHARTEFRAAVEVDGKLVRPQVSHGALGRPVMRDVGPEQPRAGASSSSQPLQQRGRR